MVFSNKSDKNIILYVIAVTGVIGFIAGIAFDNHILRMITKPLPVLVLLFLLKPDTLFKKLIFTGFILSLIGDILLETGENLFVYGLSAFLTAHIFYISAFLRRKQSRAIIPAIFLVIFGGWYYGFLFPGLGEMRLPVLIYILVILTMVWSSFTQYKYNGYSKYATTGALFFMFSDSLIAYTKFHSPIPFSRYIIILTYWIAQYLIYLSTEKSD